MARDKITNHREAVNIVTCPVMRSLLVLGGKWKLLLLYLLAFESKGGHLRRLARRRGSPVVSGPRPARKRTGISD